MNIAHLLTISTSCYSGAPIVLGLYKNEPILITVSRDSSCDLTVYTLDGRGRYHQPLAVLSGHKTSINYISLSKDEQWLFSASKDSLLLWQLNSCLDTTHDLVRSKTREIFLNNTNSILFSCFNTNPCDHLLICQGSETYVIELHSCRVSCDLVTNSRVTCGTFYNSKCLVLACEDRTFQLWDISTISLIYQSSIVSAFPFTCVDSTDRYLVFGSTNSMLRVYSSSGLMTKSCDLVLHEIMLPNRSHDSSSDNISTEIDDQSIISVYSSTSLIDKQDNHYSQLMTEKYSLLAVTHSGIILYNGFNAQLIGQFHISDSITSFMNPHEPKYTIQFISTANFVQTSTNEILCSLSSVFNGTVSLIRIRINHLDSKSELSVLSSVPIMRDSILKSELVPRSPPKASSFPIRSSEKGQTFRGQVGIKDQPLTFKSKIKSSGYSQQPRMTMFSPHTNKPLPSSSVKKKKTLDEKVYIGGYKYDELSLKYSTTSIDNTPVTHSLFNGAGTQFFYTANNIAYIMKLPCTSSSRCVPLTHDGDILSISCSHDNRLLITSSSDGSAKVWRVNPCNQRPIMNMTKQLHNLKEMQSKDNKPFFDSLTHSMFYYMDKFILLTCGNTINMYKYHLDTTKLDDIKRYQTKSHYKMASQITLDSAPHSVTALSCINDFHSNLVLAAGSDRSLQVYDMNTMKWVWLTHNAHKRPVHYITQNHGSKFINCNSSESHDLFATSSITDGIKLWDMRSQRCVRWYNCHKNRSHPVSTCFSPCGCYLATGSEDNMVYIYDTRYLEPVNKLVCKTKVVSTVNYHPQRSLITGATLEGEISFFENISHIQTLCTV